MLIDLVIGGLSGVISRTLTAPLELYKIQRQNAFIPNSTVRAVLKKDGPEIVDGIGDCVVVLTNLAELIEVPIEECIEAAYNEIKTRKGKMANGTYVKND